MDTVTATYNKRFSLALVAYIILVLICTTLVNQMDKDNNLRYLLIILPMIPVGFGFSVFMTFVRQIDELQQNIHFQGFAFSLGVTGLITFTLGFLEIAGLPKIGMIWVFPMIIALWGIGSAIARRPYK